jgi:hypothetical protein
VEIRLSARPASKSAAVRRRQNLITDLDLKHILTDLKNSS